MSDTRNDGGPAFPRHYGTSFSAERETSHWHGGMSLRDHFAGQAMAAYLVSSSTSKTATDNADTCAEWAYLQADAMLRERAK